MDDGEGDHLTTSFSQLLFSDNDNDVFHSFDHFPSSSSSVINPPKMLCFEGYLHRLHQHQKSGVTCTDSSSSSATTSTTSTTPATIVNLSTASKSNRKRNGSGQETGKYTPSIAKAPLSSQRSSKKIKKETSISNCQPKARKEKLGERITALQQLVSPFGKTDTASVLHEAMGYIRFLHDQVQVLCSPYLQHQPVTEGGENGGEETRKELRSRGLCLAPVECALHVASSNGADYWSPAMSSTKQ